MIFNSFPCQPKYQSKLVQNQLILPFLWQLSKVPDKKDTDHLDIEEEFVFDYVRPGSHDAILERNVLPCLDHFMHRTDIGSFGDTEVSDHLINVDKEISDHHDIKGFLPLGID